MIMTNTAVAPNVKIECNLINACYVLLKTQTVAAYTTCKFQLHEN